MFRPDQTYWAILLLLFNGGVKSIYAQEVPTANQVAREIYKRQFSGLRDSIKEFTLFHSANPGSSSSVKGQEDPQFLELNQENVHELMQSKNEAFQVEIPYRTDTLTLMLYSCNPLAPGFTVSSSSGTRDTVSTSFFRGIIKGDLRSIVALSIHDREVSGMIASSKWSNLSLMPSSVDDQVHILFREDHSNVLSNFDCETVFTQGYQYQSKISSPETAREYGTKSLQIYFETSYSIYEKFGKNLDKTINFITGLFNQVAVIYANENIDLVLSDLYIWTHPDPYAHENTAAALESFIQAPLKGYGDLRHLLDMTDGDIGGRAYVDVLCDKVLNAAYCNIFAEYEQVPAYSWSVNVITHEIGHGIGSLHTQDCVWGANQCSAIDGCAAPNPNVGCGTCNEAPIPDRGTIMSYCHLHQGIDFSQGFGKEPGELLRSRIAEATCLESGEEVNRSLCHLSIENIDVVPATCGLANAEVKITISGAGGAQTYDLGDGPQTESSFKGIAPGNYQIVVKDGFGCLRTAEVIVPNTSDKPEMEIIVNNASCNGKDGWLEIIPSSGQAAFQYHCDEIVSSEAVFSGLIPGDYVVGMTDDQGCSESRQVSIFEEMAPELIVGMEPTQCGLSNGGLQLSGFGGSMPYDFIVAGIGHDFDTIVKAQRSHQVEGLGEGDYQIWMYDDQGCQDSLKITVDNSENLDVNITTQSASCDDGNGSINIAVTGGKTPYRYFLDDSTIHLPMIDHLHSGMYSIKVIDAQQCEISIPIQVDFDPTYIAPRLPDRLIVCEGDQVILNTGLSSDIHVTWRHENRVLEETSPSIPISASGIYQAMIQYQDECLLHAQTEVIMAGSPNLSIEGEIIVCQDSDYDLPNPDPGLLYLWSTGTSGSKTSFPSSGAYTLEVVNEFGCTEVIPFNVSIVPPIQLEVEKTSVILCEGHETQLKAYGAKEYFWTSDDPDLLDKNVPDPFIAPQLPYSYRVVGKNHCFSDSIDIEVSFHDFVKTLPVDTLVPQGSTLTFSLPGAKDVDWKTTLPIDCADCSQVQVKVESDSELRVNYTDSNGCFRTDSTKILAAGVGRALPEKINVITPNGDGKNDVLQFSGLEAFSGVRLQIFDLNGSSVFSSEDYKNNWSGTRQGEVLPEGIYFYVLLLKDGNKVYKMDSELTIIRN